MCKGAPAASSLTNTNINTNTKRNANTNTNTNTGGCEVGATQCMEGEKTSRQVGECTPVEMKEELRQGSLAGMREKGKSGQKQEMIKKINELKTN